MPFGRPLSARTRPSIRCCASRSSSRPSSATTRNLATSSAAAKVRTYSRDFSKAYHARLNGQVERQLRYAAALIGDFWFTCWVDGGSPDLRQLQYEPSAKEQQRLEPEAKETAGAPATASAPGHDE